MNNNTDNTEKGYVSKPQLHIERKGGIVKYRCQNCKMQYYILLGYMKGIAFGKVMFLYANEYIPYKTLKEIMQRRNK